MSSCGADEHERDERGVAAEPSPVEQDRGDGADDEDDGRATEERDDTKDVDAGRRSLTGEPAGVIDVPACEWIVRQVVLRDAGKGQGGEERPAEGEQQAPLWRRLPGRGGPAHEALSAGIVLEQADRSGRHRGTVASFRRSSAEAIRPTIQIASSVYAQPRRMSTR